MASTNDMNELRQIKIDKLNRLKEMGKDPFKIEKFERTDFSNDIIGEFESKDGTEVIIAGRIMAKREMGKAFFIDVQDSKGRIQVYVRNSEIGDEEFSIFKTYDLGDIVGIKGNVFKTKKEEISIRAKEVTLLTKTIQTLPEKYHGLKDTELRYRQRYVDLIVNPEIKETFLKRTQIIKKIREILDNEGFLEVETPILSNVAGGANANPFLTHHNALNMEMQMRIANELFLKRLIVGGFDKVYEIGKMFRNEGISVKHNPEFTNIEVYAAYEDYKYVMNLTEVIVSECCKAVNNGSTVVDFQGREIDFKAPWRRVSMHDLVEEVTGIDFYGMETVEEARKVAREKLKLEVDDDMTKGLIVNLAFEEFCEETLVQPTFVLHHPVEISPLSKRNPDNPSLTNRFEAFANGWEIANAFSELNDPIDQRERFEEQMKQRENGDEEAHPMDEDFLRAIEVGLPPTGGLGIGVDRMIMLLTNSPSIRDIIFFPTMKPLK